MLSFEFEKELLDALEKAEFGTDAIPAYTFNIIVPVIEKYAAQLRLQTDAETAAQNGNVQNEVAV